MSTHKSIALLALTLVVSGCASINPQQGFNDVSIEVEQRLGSRVHWYTGSEEDAQVQQSIQNLLEQPLTVDSAVQIALLNNQSLQAEYANLGISQADLVQAGLLKNPALEITRVKPRKSDEPDDALDIDLRFEFLDNWFPGNGPSPRSVVLAGPNFGRDAPLLASGRIRGHEVMPVARILPDFF